MIPFSEEILTKSIWLNPVYVHFKEVRKSKINPEFIESSGQGKLNSVHICILISTTYRHRKIKQ